MESTVGLVDNWYVSSVRIGLLRLRYRSHHLGSYRLCIWINEGEAIDTAIEPWGLDNFIVLSDSFLDQAVKLWSQESKQSHIVTGIRQDVDLKALRLSFWPSMYLPALHLKVRWVSLVISLMQCANWWYSEPAEPNARGHCLRITLQSMWALPAFVYASKARRVPLYSIYPGQSLIWLAHWRAELSVGCFPFGICTNVEMILCSLIMIFGGHSYNSWWLQVYVWNHCCFVILIRVCDVPYATQQSVTTLDTQDVSVLRRQGPFGATFDALWGKVTCVWRPVRPGKFFARWKHHNIH